MGSGKYTGKFVRGVEFVALHPVKKGDTLKKIAKQWGFENPGPIIAYPNNLPLIPFRVVDHRYDKHRYRLSRWAPISKELDPERTPVLFIPAPNDWLAFYVVHTSQLMKRYTKIAQKEVSKVVQDAEDVKDMILLAEALAVVAGMAASFIGLAKEGIKLSGGTAAEATKALTASAKARITAQAIAMSANPLTLVLPKPIGLKKSGARYHAHKWTGWAWSASWWSGFWTGLIVGGDEGADIWMHGPDAITVKTANRIMARLSRDLIFLQEAIGAAGRQMQAPYYKHKVIGVDSQRENASWAWVTSGCDTLWKISKSYYGSGAHWKRIYDANREKIGRDPNILKDGLVLTVPFP